MCLEAINRMMSLSRNVSDLDGECAQLGHFFLADTSSSVNIAPSNLVTSWAWINASSTLSDIYDKPPVRSHTLLVIK